MRQTIKEAIREETEESKVDSSFKNSRLKIENFISTNTEGSPRKNIHQSIKKEDTINEDKQQFFSGQKSTSIDVNGLRSLSNKTPQSKFFDQSFFTNDQKIPNKVIDEFSQLTTFIEDLNKKIAEIVIQSESDFLRIYKEQMRDVYQELLKLKRRIEDEDFKLRKDSKILVLSQERNYFYQQALYLDQKCRVFEQENQQLKFKNKILSEDLIHYQGILIDSKKESKQLKEELLFLYGNQNDLANSMQDRVWQTENPKEKSFREKIFNLTNVQHKQIEVAPSFKRSSSQKYLISNQNSSNFLPSTPVSSSSLNRKRQLQNNQEIERKKSEKITSPTNELEQIKKELNQPSQEINQLLQENQLLKSHINQLKNSKKNIKLDIQISNKGSNATDLDKTRPDSIKSSKKEFIYKKQLQKLSTLFKLNQNV